MNQSKLANFVRSLEQRYSLLIIIKHGWTTPAIRSRTTSEADSGGLTSVGVGGGEAEVVHGVQRQQMAQELLPLLLRAQKRVTLVQTPVVDETILLVNSNTEASFATTGAERGELLTPADHLEAKKRSRAQSIRGTNCAFIYKHTTFYTLSFLHVRLTSFFRSVRHLPPNV